MSYGTKQFLKTAANQFIDDFSWFSNIASSPARSVCYRVCAKLEGFETSSKRLLNESHERAKTYNDQSRDRANIYNKFIAFKDEFALSSKRDEKYVYHLLCSISLALPHSEPLMYHVTASIDAERKSAIKQFGKAMRELSQAGTRNLMGHQTLTLGN